MTPITVAGIATPVTVAAIHGPVTVAAGDTPVTVSLSRPELDPERIETGTLLSGASMTCAGMPCTKLVDGPFVLTDVLVRPGAPGPFDSRPPSASLFVGTAVDPLAPHRWTVRFDGGGATGDVSTGVTPTGRYVEVAWAPVTITGARLAVRAGESLYASVTPASQIQVLWSGFRP